MIRHLLSVLLLVAATAPANALDRMLTPQEEQLIQQINQHNSAIDTMVGRFLQVDTQGGRTEGTFFLDRPNKVKFRYAPPSRQEIVSVGRGFYILNRQEETAYAYPQESVPLRQFLNEQIDLMAANVIDVVSSPDYLTVTLSDDTPAGTVEVSLIFDVETKDLAQWTLTEPSGAELTFSVYDVTKNVEIPQTLFSIPANYSSPDTQ